MLTAKKKLPKREIPSPFLDTEMEYGDSILDFSSSSEISPSGFSLRPPDSSILSKAQPARDADRFLSASRLVSFASGPRQEHGSSFIPRRHANPSPSSTRTSFLSHKLAQLIDSVHLKGALSRYTAVAASLLAIVLLLTIFLIGLFVSSPFGIFFAGQTNESGAIPLSAAINTVNCSLNDALEEIYTAEDYTDIEIDGAPAPWAEILSAFSAEFGFSESVCTFTPQLVQKLQDTFWEMTTISYAVDEVIEEPVLDDNGNILIEGSTERYLTITIDAQSANDYAASHHFTSVQTQTMQEILSLSDSLMETIGSLSVLSDDAKSVLSNLPVNLSPERRSVIKKACALVGKVPYFWGGKSYRIGWDSRWGQLMKVVSSGSPSTGTYRPYGLDCTGYVNWCFYNALHRSGLAGTPVSMQDLQPGDLLYTEDEGHVGLYCGTDFRGEKLAIHCASGVGVVITSASIFTHAISPSILTS